MLNLLLDLCTMCMWTVLLTKVYPASVCGSKWLWWVNVHVYLGLGPAHQCRKSKSWCIILASRDSGQGRVIKGPILQLFPIHCPYWLGWGIHSGMGVLDENTYIHEHWLIMLTFVLKMETACTSETLATAVVTFSWWKDWRAEEHQQLNIFVINWKCIYALTDTEHRSPTFNATDEHMHHGPFWIFF